MLALRKKIVKVLKTQGLTKEDALLLEKLVYKLAKAQTDSSAEQNYAKIAYEKIGQVQFVEFSKIVSDLKKGKDGWDSYVFKPYQETLSHTRDVIATTDTGIKEGEFQCSRCKSRKIKSTQLQTRKADEGFTTFLQCTKCSKRWKMG